MNKIKLKAVIISLLISTIANSQNYIDFKSTGITTQDQLITKATVNLFSWKVYSDKIVEDWSSKKIFIYNKKKKEENLLETQAKINLVKTTYKDSERYPETIIDGWHNVITTDGYNYCSPAKVLVKKNEVKELVFDNWIRLSKPFTNLSSIKKGKSLLSVDMEGEIETLELYFINDMEEPIVVDKPLESGFITFWRDSNKINKIKIYFEENYYGELGKEFTNQPECAAIGTITIEAKPGIHHFKAESKGSTSWEGDVEVKENLCLSYLLNKNNKKD